MDKLNLAKSILYNVCKQGKPEQQAAARQLIDSLK
jgi:FimV-like protein